METSGHHEREHFFSAAKLIAALTVLSRISAVPRSMGIAWLGASRATDAFQLAFLIPNLFRRLFGEGALAGALVPVLTETAQRDGWERARQLLQNALGLLAVFLTVLVLVLLAGLATWRFFWPGEWDRQLLIGLVALMLPYMVFVCLLALGSAALNCRGHFAYPAFAPILLNLFMIAAVWGIAPLVKTSVVGTLHLVAGSVLVAGVVQLAGVLWLLKAGGYAVRPTLRPVQPGVRQIIRLMAPMLLGLGFLQLTSLFDSVAGWIFTATEYHPTIRFLGWELPKPLTTGVLVRLSNANLLYQFPMGVLAISLGVAIFPLLSRYAARGEIEHLRNTLNRALRLSVMEGLASGTGLVLLAEPIIQLIFQHGKFTAADTTQTAAILRFYAVALWAFCSYPILIRVFYAMKNPSTPLKISCALAVLYMALVLGLIWIPGLSAAAFSLSAAITFTLNVLILATVLRGRIGSLGGRALLASVVRSAAACAVMAAGILLLRWWIEPAPAWRVVLVCVPAGAAVFFLTAWLLRAPELGELLRKVPAEDS